MTARSATGIRFQCPVWTGAAARAQSTSSMGEDLPPIAFLRAFSRAAETLSFKEAAAELNLSPSAVSRQIQSLEAHLGVALFRRLNPGLEITDAGRRYLETVNRVLGELRRAQQGFTVRPSGPLRVSALESFTESWLIPHLADFEPADPRRHTIIHVSQTPDAWSEWLRQAGVAELQPRRAVTYDHLAIALSAAESGHGVALSSEFLCAKRLAAGRLCAPFRVRARSASTYHLVCRPEGLEDPRIMALRDWLVDALA